MAHRWALLLVGYVSPSSIGGCNTTKPGICINQRSHNLSRLMVMFGALDKRWDNCDDALAWRSLSGVSVSFWPSCFQSPTPTPEGWRWPLPAKTSVPKLSYTPILPTATSTATEVPIVTATPTTVPTPVATVVLRSDSCATLNLGGESSVQERERLESIQATRIAEEGSGSQTIIEHLGNCPRD